MNDAPALKRANVGIAVAGATAAAKGAADIILTQVGFGGGRGGWECSVAVNSGPDSTAGPAAPQQDTQLLIHLLVCCAN